MFRLNIEQRRAREKVVARPVLIPNKKQRAALAALANKPDAGLAMTTQETIVALRHGCLCAKPYRGCVRCIAAELIQRMDRIINAKKTPRKVQGKFTGTPCICVERLALQADPECPIHGVEATVGKTAALSNNKGETK